MADEPKTAETQSPSTAEPEPAVVAAGEEAAEPARAKQDAASKADPSPGTASLDRDMMRLMVCGCPSETEEIRNRARNALVHFSDRASWCRVGHL